MICFFFSPNSVLKPQLGWVTSICSWSIHVVGQSSSLTPTMTQMVDSNIVPFWSPIPRPCQGSMITWNVTGIYRTYLFTSGRSKDLKCVVVRRRLWSVVRGPWSVSIDSPVQYISFSLFTYCRTMMAFQRIKNLRFM
jgi:hypothetical protein